MEVRTPHCAGPLSMKIELGRLVRIEHAALDLHAEWARAMRRPNLHRDRLVDRAYLSAARRPLTEEIAYLRLLVGWRNRWRYVRGYLATDYDYAVQHGRSGAFAQARYLVSKLRSGAP